jgi:hypothetical protein
MTLEALPDKDKIALAADWMELAAILNSRRTSSPADLVRSLAILDEPEHGVVSLDGLIDGQEDDDGLDDEKLEEEIIQSASEQWASDVREELGTRATSLSDAYPFQITGSGTDWLLRYQPQPERHDHLFYSCCLLITARRYSLITRDVPNMDKMMQIIAYLVAGRLVEGTSYWFGWPRPDDTNQMVAAIEEVLKRMGFSELLLAPPVWSVGDEKDEGIDIVAWKNFGDGLPARIVLYGQVASGKNWEGKSVTQYTESTIPIWFGAYGQRWYVPAMFVPWPQYLMVEARNGRGFRQRVVETSIKHEKVFGVTVDRGRIAELASEKTSTGNDDEDKWVKDLTEWRSAVLTTLLE